MRGGGLLPSLKPKTHQNPDALEIYYKAIIVEIKIYVWKLAVSFSGLSNKIDCLYVINMQSGSSWVQSDIGPSSQVLVLTRVTTLVTFRRRQLQSQAEWGWRKVSPCPCM